MTRVEMFAIRQISTGRYLPTPQGRQGRGGSHVEPIRFPVVPGKNRQSLLPRLFATKATAKGALTHWLKGKVVAHRSYVIDAYWEEVDIELIPADHRNKEDMEIVSVFVELP